MKKENSNIKRNKKRNKNRNENRNENRKENKTMIFIGTGLLIFGGLTALLGSIGPTMGSKALPFFCINLVGIFGIAIGAGLLTIAMIIGMIGMFMDEKPKLVSILKEIFQFTLSCLIYGFTAFMCIGFILLFDQDWKSHIAGTVTAGIVTVVSVIVMIFFRKYRKKHPVKLSHVQMILIMALCIGLSGFYFYASIMKSVQFIKDAASGFQLIETFLEEVRPVKEYNRKAPNTYYLRGIDESGKEINYQIDSKTYQEWKKRSKYKENMTATIYYYTNIRVVYEID